MLEIIKMLLDITDTSEDAKIVYNINAVTRKVLKYCSLKQLPEELEDVIIQIVMCRMDENKSGTVVEKTDVGVWSETVTKTPTLEELSPHKSLLNSFRKISYI